MFFYFKILYLVLKYGASVKQYFILRIIFAHYTHTFTPSHTLTLLDTPTHKSILKQAKQSQTSQHSPTC